MPETKEKQQVISAINSLGRKVTAADIATKTGLKLNEATLLLNTVASETQGNLVVSKEGQIAYQFKPAFQTAYLTKGLMAVFEKLTKSLFRLMLFLLRISFGIMLILSLLIIAIAVFVIIMRGSYSSDSKGRSSFRLSFFDLRLLEDIFFWNFAYRRHNRGLNQPTTSYRKDGGFLMNCFSFLFGDGNPNLNLEERKWQEIAGLIRSKQGVVTSEELAPYTGADPRFEDGVLPVLVRFNGKPEVTDTGNIVYMFSDLSYTASEYGYSDSKQDYLYEWKYKFSECSMDALIPVIILAAINFLGSLWLHAQTIRYIDLAAFGPISSVLVIYGTLFITIPAIRYFVISYLNGRIELRNRHRQDFALKLRSPDPQLSQKLNEAKTFQTKTQNISAAEISYTTEKDLLDQDL